jgi:DnaK suppressor protein
VEDGAFGDGQLIGQIANPVRGSDARSILRTARPRPATGPRRSARQRIAVAGERGATIALALRRLEREHVALLLAICELEDPTDPIDATEPTQAALAEQPSPAMREALLVLLRDDLDRTQRALSLAAQGRYGLCEDCGRPIARRELELSPAAIRCAACETLARRS